MLPRWAIAAVVALGAAQAWSAYSHRPVPTPDGVLVAREPQQTAISAATEFAHGDFRLTPLADFRFDARVLLVSRYRFDTEAALAPYDLGIGWMRMSDSAVINQIELSQTARFLLWRWSGAPPLPEAEITRSAANIHVIPANSVIARQLGALRPGQVIAARGRLVEAVRSDGWRWRSSLVRDDGGNGACELMYLESLQVIGP